MSTSLTLGPPHSPTDATRRHVRGSALLLVGRLISLGLNFAGQVLVVRHLSKHDFGALALGLSVVALGSAMNVFGFPKTIARFAPLYLEREDRARLLGSIVLSLGAIAALGVAVVLAAFGLRGYLGGDLGVDPAAVSLLLVLIALTPLGALDVLLEQLLAVFSGARSIFLRRHVLAPALRLLAILAVVAFHGDARLLAQGYLVGGVLGSAVYVALLVRVLRSRGVFRGVTFRWAAVPVREILGFALPLLSSDLLFLVRTLGMVVLLELYYAEHVVAEFRAVVPLARLNTLVQTNFTFLFIPAAARLLARRDRDAMHALTARSVGWVTVLSFPILAATLCFSEPVTVFLFGERYASSAGVLRWLALSSYLHAVFALDGELLKVMGRIRRVVASDLASLGAGLGLGFLLIPPHGAVGAAMAIVGAQVTHRVLMRVALARAADLPLLPAAQARVLVFVACGLALLTGLEVSANPPLFSALAATFAVTLALLWICRRTLAIEETFPELVHLPGLGSFLRS